MSWPLLRKIVRIVLLLAVTGVCYAALLLVLALLLPVPRARRRGRNLLYHRWSRSCLRLLGGRLRVEGRPPTAPFFLVTNHLSYIDVIVLAARLDAFLIAKLEIRSWPLFGLLARTVGTIFVDRELRRDVVRVNRLIENVLQQGYGVILFPEGTSTQGYEVAEFRSALLDYPARTGMPVHAAALSYRTPAGEVPAHLGVSWWGEAPFARHVWRLLGLRSFEAVLRFSPRTVAASDRKELADLGRAAVVEVFEPVVSPEKRATETGFERSQPASTPQAGGT